MIKCGKRLYMFLATSALVGIISLSPLNVETARAYEASDHVPNIENCPQLPSNFDPLDASLDELRQFHLPPRPSDPVQLADWLQRLKRIKHIV